MWKKIIIFFIFGLLLIPQILSANNKTNLGVLLRYYVDGNILVGNTLTLNGDPMMNPTPSVGIYFDYWESKNLGIRLNAIYHLMTYDQMWVNPARIGEWTRDGLGHIFTIGLAFHLSSDRTKKPQLYLQAGAGIKGEFGKDKDVYTPYVGQDPIPPVEETWDNLNFYWTGELGFRLRLAKGLEFIIAAKADSYYNYRIPQGFISLITGMNVTIL